MKKGMASLTGGILLGMMFVAVQAVLASEGEEGGHAVHWLATDTYRWINFAFLFAVMFWAIRKYIVPLLRNRVQGIADELSSLEEKKQAAEKELADMTGRLANMEKEAQDIIAHYVQQGEEAKARILKEAQAAAERLSEQAKRNVEQEFALAKERLRQEILNKAMAMGEDIVKKNITAQDQDRLVGEYIEKVVAQ